MPYLPSMDILAHAVYGATICSRPGLAGGRTGAGRPWFRDWTAWAAMLFGILPDALSMGLPFLQFEHGDHVGHFFREFDGAGLIHYRYAHSLLVALAVSGLLRLLRRPLFLPSLAWPLHLALDALTHASPGKFHTELFYPLSSWAFNGLSWWQHPGLVALYWLALPAAWLALCAWRARGRP
ncbi:MAG TPA: hypothetical protein P5567_00330 [Kiritimatiellia bacterium]|nr:hypothetical protein [Kiritimatiellia bacterium]HRZ10881.1 hypothetical protein [Kiritimatiellia bacterium]HSA18846.1 hypothetical protein [Kiritimatiellia bacterium]